MQRALLIFTAQTIYRLIGVIDGQWNGAHGKRRPHNRLGQGTRQARRALEEAPGRRVGRRRRDKGQGQVHGRDSVAGPPERRGPWLHQDRRLHQAEHRRRHRRQGLRLEGRGQGRREGRDSAPDGPEAAALARLRQLREDKARGEAGRQGRLDTDSHVRDRLQLHSRAGLAARRRQDNEEHAAHCQGGARVRVRGKDSRCPLRGHRRAQERDTEDKGDGRATR